MIQKLIDLQSKGGQARLILADHLVKGHLAEDHDGSWFVSYIDDDGDATKAYFHSLHVEEVAGDCIILKEGNNPNRSQ